VNLLVRKSYTCIYTLAVPFIECLLSFGSESFVFQFVIQKYKD